MTTRMLPPDEWSRVPEMPLPEVRDAATTGIVLAVEDEGAIVGSCAIFQCVHVEGLWVHPAYRRKVAVGRHLWRGTRDVIASMGAHGALTMPSTEMAAIWRARGAVDVLGEQLLVVMR